MKGMMNWLKESCRDYGDIINKGLDCGMVLPPYQSFYAG